MQELQEPRWPIYFLVFNTVLELAAAADAVFGNFKLAGSGVSFKDVNKDNSNASWLVENVGGPLAMGTCGVVSLASLFTKETKSKTVWLVLVYYHAMISYAISKAALNNEHTALFKDARPPFVIHSLMAIASMRALLTY